MKTLSAILITIIFLLVSAAPSFSIQASSDTEPAKYVKSRGKTQVNFNIHQIDVTDMDGKTRKAWEYDYVEVEGSVTKAKFKEALRKEDLEKKAETIWIPDEAVLEYKEKIKPAEILGK